MIVGTVILIAIVVLGTMVMARRAARAGRQASVAQFIVVAGVVMVVVVGSIGAGWYGVARYEYERCVDAVHSRDAYRQTFTNLYDSFDAATGTAHYTVDSLIPGRPSLRDALELDRPALDIADCQRP